MANSLIDSLSKGQTTKIDSSKKDISLAKRSSDNNNYFLRMFMAELKNQDPTQPMDTMHITQTMSAMSQTQAQIETTEAVKNMSQYFQKSMLTEAESYMGKNIYYDNSSKDFVGNQVDFEYEVKCDKETLPKNRQNLTRITIKDEKSKVIFHKALYTLEPGLNKFRWDGIMDNGRMAEKMKKYTIEIHAGYNMRDPSGVEQFNEVESTTNLEGKVTEAFRDARDNVKLKVGSSLISMDRIRGRSEKGDEISKQSAAENIENYLGYINKKITVNQDSLQVQGGFAYIKFDNPFPQAAKVKVEVLNEYGGVESYIIHDAHLSQVGSQNFRWDGRICKSFEDLEAMPSAEYSKLEKIKDGAYKYKIYVEDRSSGKQNNFVQLATESEEIVTGVDFSEVSGVKLLSKNGGYNIKDVKKIEVAGIDKRSLALDAAGYVGKSVTTISNKFGVSAEGEAGVIFPLEAPQAGMEYGNAYMKVLSDKGVVLTTITKPASGISYAEKLKVPNFAELSDTSKEYINNYISSNSVYANYDAIAIGDAEMMSKANKFIKDEFYSGTILTADVTEEDAMSVRLANQGFNSMILDEDTKIQPGTYNYKIEVELLDKKGKVIRMLPINNSYRNRVLEANIEGQSIRLVLDDKREVGIEDVVGVSV